MSRGWWADHRPAHLRPVVGWWAYHFPRLTFYRPRACLQCGLINGHKMDCKRPPTPTTPWYITVGFIVAGLATNFFVGYILANWMPATVGLFGWAITCLIVAMAFNVLLYRVYRDWQRVR